VHHLLKLSTLLSSCGIVVTGSSTTANAALFRTAIPVAWGRDVVVGRVAVRRAEVLKFAPGISVEEAEGERERRWEVVRRGRFECWRIGGAAQGGRGGVKEGQGFVFRVGDVGVEIERAAKEGVPPEVQGRVSSN
jgi:hypothetical protein